MYPSRHLGKGIDSRNTAECTRTRLTRTVMQMRCLKHQMDNCASLSHFRSLNLSLLSLTMFNKIQIASRVIVQDIVSNMLKLVGGSSRKSMQL